MSQTTRMIPKLNDRDLISAFQAMASRFEGCKVRYADRLGAVDENGVEDLKSHGAYFLTNATLTAYGVNWLWERTSESSSDKLTFSWNDRQGPPNRSHVAKFSAELDKSLVRPLLTAGEGDFSASADPATQREILLALEGTAAKVLTEAVEHRNDLDRRYAEKEQQLLARFEEQRRVEFDRLSEEKKRADETATSRRQLLDQKETELATRQKQLDDRNNTHVRREIRAALMSLVQGRLENFSVSRETRAQYWLVHFVCLAAIAGLTFATYTYSAGAVASDGSATSQQLAPDYFRWVALLKAAVFAAVAIAIGTWYVKWLNRWLQRIADAEFKLQQFRLDIERASWLAETVLEWKSITDEPFPDLLATRLSTGLFETGSTEADDPRTPASQLAEALIGAATTTKIKIGDQEITLDRKGVRKLQAE